MTPITFYCIHRESSTLPTDTGQIFLKICCDSVFLSISVMQLRIQLRIPHLLITYPPLAFFFKLKLFVLFILLKYRGFPGGSMVKNPPANGGDMGSIPRLGRYLAEGKGNPLLYSYLENTIDRRAWWATVYGVTKGQTRLSD